MRDYMLDFTTEFYVDGESKTVVCVLKPDIDNAIIIASEATGIDTRVIPGNLLLNSTYRGIAKCSDNDTFDEAVGKDIAYKKAYAKYSTATLKKLEWLKKDIQKDFSKWMNGLNKACNYYSEKDKTAHNKLNETLSKVM